MKNTIKFLIIGITACMLNHSTAVADVTEKFPNDVTINGISLRDKPYDEFKEWAKDCDRRFKSAFVFTVWVNDEASYSYSAEDLGCRSNFEELIEAALTADAGTVLKASVAFDSDKVRKASEYISGEFTIDAVSAKFLGCEEGVPAFEPEIIGKSLEANHVEAAITAAIKSNERECQVFADETRPPICSADITELLGEFTTYTTNSTNRNFNISLASERVSETVLQSGEVFSFFALAGNTTSAPYREAGILIDGSPATGIGGGICQYTATLYGAVRMAKLDLVEVHKHSARVPYVNYEGEAMVNQGTADFRFKNNLDRPIYIFSTYSNNVLSAYIFK